MRRTILLGLFALLAVGTANAQRRGGGGVRFAGGVQGFSRPRAFLPYGFRNAYLGYDYGGGYEYAPQPIVFVQQPPQFVEPPAPPVVEPPARPVVTDYKWPAVGGVASSSSSSTASSASGHSTTAESQPAAFAIVLKDGSTVSAVVVVAADDGLHCVDLDERHLRISMTEVDRAATLKLNRARNMNLHLPAGQ